MSKGTTRRAVRVEDDLWDPALALAKERGIHLSDVIREALRTFLTEPPHPTPQPQPAVPAISHPT